MPTLTIILKWACQKCGAENLDYFPLPPACLCEICERFTLTDDIQEDYTWLLNDRNFIQGLVGESAVEEYIADLSWGGEATEREKTLVIGNIRAFASHFRGLVATRKEKE